MLLDGAIYPIYPLPKTLEIEVEHGRTLLHSPLSTYVLDDTRVEGTFPIRRIKLKAMIAERKLHGQEYYPLYKLRSKIDTEGQLVPNLRKFRLFVDSTGKLFTYTLTKPFNLTYHKVNRIALVEGSHSIVFVAGVNTPFKLNYVPLKTGNIWAGILNLGTRKVLYELSKVKKKDTWRKL